MACGAALRPLAADGGERGGDRPVVRVQGVEGGRDESADGAPAKGVFEEVLVGRVEPSHDGDGRVEAVGGESLDGRLRRWTRKVCAARTSPSPRPTASGSRSASVPFGSRTGTSPSRVVNPRKWRQNARWCWGPRTVLRSGTRCRPTAARLPVPLAHRRSITAAVTRWGGAAVATFRTQVGASLGGYGGLQALLAALRDNHMDEDWHFLLTWLLLTPGVNVRNDVAHGLLAEPTAAYAALALRAAGLVVLIAPSPAALGWDDDLDGRVAADA